jgi:hypothetical protein
MITPRPQPELKINIAGLTVSLQCDDRQMTERLQAWYQDFLQPTAIPDFTIEVKVKAGAQFIPLEPGPWVIRSSVVDGRLTFESYFESGWVDFSRGRGELVMSPEASVENFLRVLCAHRGLERQGLLVHAAGLVRDEKAFVFFGPSGSGKTTTTRLSTGSTILSDDMVLLRVENGGVRAYGVPFRGDLPETPRSNINAPLAGLFRLRKADSHYVSPIQRPQALAELVTCVPFVMAVPDTSQRVIGLGLDIVSKAPTMNLHFRRDPGFWEVVESAIADHRQSRLAEH